MQSDTRSENILIFDNSGNPAHKIADRISTYENVKITITIDHANAISQIEKLAPDLIIIAISNTSPKSTGNKLAKIIRIAFNLPIILLVPPGSCKTANLKHQLHCLEENATEREILLTFDIALLQHRLKQQIHSTHEALFFRISKAANELSNARNEIFVMQQEKRDQHSMLRFSNALDVSADAIYLIDRVNMLFIDVNKTACERGGYSREEMLKLGPQDIKPYFDSSSLAHQFDRIAASQDRFGIIETFHRTKNNQHYPVEVRIRALESQGNPLLIAIARDISLRQEKEAALQASEARYRLLLEKSPIGLTTISLDNRITEANPAFCKMLGYSRDELLSMTLTDLTYEEDLNLSLEEARKLFEGEISATLHEKRYVRKDGTIIWGRVHGAIIRNEDGLPLFSIGMVENIDDEKNSLLIREAQAQVQKKALVREVHHRIKNHLQGVIGLLRQQLEKSPFGNNIVEHAISQLGIVASIHGLQGKDSSENIELMETCNTIIRSIQALFPNIYIHTYHDTAAFSADINRDEAVPVALAINELLFNAAKHGTGNIDLNIQMCEDGILIRISNDFVEKNHLTISGSGLELTQALLASDGIRYSHEIKHGNFRVEIFLTFPVILLKDFAHLNRQSS